MKRIMKIYLVRNVSYYMLINDSVTMKHKTMGICFFFSKHVSLSLDHVSERRDMSKYVLSGETCLNMSEWRDISKYV
jgi:hypothetical protein